MNADRRARVAYLAGSLIGKREIHSLYDRSREKTLTGGKNLDMIRVSRLAEKRSCGVKRDPQGNNFCIINEAGQHLCFSVYGRIFDGYDHQSHSHFSGTVLDEFISLFDYGASDYFCYRI
ncbi:hypothetical protein SAMN05660860_01478 [Geoalkalibacter ferrihydriticus]|uniref:Uncharacterized protein n=2 Tax=Geoalkalibacter ferrihydriticus TaxID=392333 RepID=A0A0C2ECU9_9BACT|nr:hypothetical protein [Geoalkalibacter ferrihydriticus]KIH76418.1 hypothetical protein GFER_09330 [Geoalkalibacter ferrihydriticus DSM 17813]SDL93689.1 hypothetical protein SAMN05660860_01478 [Geoalkalibacter ferrihydriticus]